MKSVRPESHFIELGFDSLLLTQVALNCKKEFALPISFRQLNENYTSLELLAVYLDENLSTDVYQESLKPVPISNPASIQYLSDQIEMLARQVASLQKEDGSTMSKLPNTGPQFSQDGRHQLTEAGTS